MLLNYKSYGSNGHPLIILHGLLGMLDNWQTQSKIYAEAGFKVYAVDQRNHGRSPHSSTFNYTVMAEDVNDFMSQHDIPHANVLGHSMGGKTAMQFALTHPGMVDKLVVADVAPRKYRNAHDEILDAMWALDLDHIKTRQEADREIAKRLPDYSLRQFILKNLNRTEDGTLHWKVNLPVIRKHYGQIADDITADGVFDKPALFVKSERSSYLLESDYGRIKQLFPRSAVKVLPGTGHWVHADAPQEFARTVMEFLRS